MRIVIVGGGVAGLTLAGHLRTRGMTPIVVERVPEYGRVGFWIGLYPFSANTLRETGAFERYAEESLQIGDYVMHSSDGGELQRLSLADTLAGVGGYMGALHRADLIDLLLTAAEGSELRMGTTVAGLDDQGDTVGVTLSTGETVEADLVVGADGIHSQTRATLLGDLGLDDWGYTAFTWWAPEDPAVGIDVHEFWGAGALLGLYPMAGKIDAIGGVPTPQNLDEMDQAAIRAHLRETFADYPEPVARALDALEDGDVLPWPMVDQRSPEWIFGRVALVGDAATGFLPTAGVGASNAIKSAAVLADELGRADAETIPHALVLWERRMRARVEGNQQDSRRLAKMMFVRGRTVAHARDLLLRHYPVEKVAEQVMQSNTKPF